MIETRNTKSLSEILKRRDCLEGLIVPDRILFKRILRKEVGLDLFRSEQEPVVDYGGDWNEMPVSINYREFCVHLVSY
jgi:hypothetical protein